MTVLGSWFDFLATGCELVEAPAAEVDFISVLATVDLNGTGGSIFASGVVVASRATWTRGDDAGDLANQFAILRNECGCPGASTIVGNPIDPFGDISITDPPGSVLARAYASVTDPFGELGMIELCLNTTPNIFLSVSAAIKVGGQTWSSGAVGYVGYTEPSTWAQTLGTYNVVLDFTGGDPSGTVSFTFDIT